MFSTYIPTPEEQLQMAAIDADIYRVCSGFKDAFLRMDPANRVTEDFQRFAECIHILYPRPVGDFHPFVEARWSAHPIEGRDIAVAAEAILDVGLILIVLGIAILIVLTVRRIRR